MVNNKIDSKTKENSTDNLDSKESSKSNYTMGVTCLLGSVLCFSLMNLFVRLVMREESVITKVTAQPIPKAFEGFSERPRKGQHPRNFEKI